MEHTPMKRLGTDDDLKGVTGEWARFVITQRASDGSLRLNDLLPYPWASIQFAPEITEGLRRLTGVASVDDLPLAMSCDNQDLLREMTLHTDHLLFTWTAWLERDIARGEIVDLHERLRRQVPEAIFQISCAIVRLEARNDC